MLAGEPCWTPVRGCGRRPSQGLRGEAGDGDALSLLSVASAGLGQAAGKGVGVLWLWGGPCRPPALPTPWSWTLPSVPIWALLGHRGVALSVSTHRQDVLVSAQNVSAPGASVPDPGGSQRRGLARWPRKPPRNLRAQEAPPSPGGPRKPSSEAHLAQRWPLAQAVRRSSAGLARAPLSGRGHLCPQQAPLGRAVPGGALGPGSCLRRPSLAPAAARAGSAWESSLWGRGLASRCLLLPPLLTGGAAVSSLLVINCFRPRCERGVKPAGRSRGRPPCGAPGEQAARPCPPVSSLDPTFISG